jgi:phenylalanyl-tRNA synthetase beta subunit
MLPAMRRLGSRSVSISISMTIVFDLKLTPNRADCLSLTGMAREVGRLTDAARYVEVR